MNHYPVFLAMTGTKITVSGSDQEALAKLRLLTKTPAHITVYGDMPCSDLIEMAKSGKITLVDRALEKGDVIGSTLFYAANDDTQEDARVSEIARGEGALVNVVDNLEQSQFITPAIVDRSPVTVAIGTEGAAPVLARSIKAHLEQYLSPTLGVLTKIGQSFRKAAEQIPQGRARRAFWSDYYHEQGPQAFEKGGAEAAETLLAQLLKQHSGQIDKIGRVTFVGAGPGDPELLTLKARRVIDDADVIIYDRLVGLPILELARREAIFVDVGKTGFGPSVSQDEINALIVEHTQNGHHVVRLKGGDASVFGRLDEEIETLETHGVEWSVIPGITAASAAAAAIGQSLTKRGRNTELRLLTGHDMVGFAEHDWRALAQKGQVAAIYMGKKSARFIQGRLMVHGASAQTPISIIENASRPEQRILETDLAHLPQSLCDNCIDGPALILYGIAPRDSISTKLASKSIAQTLSSIKEFA